MFFISTSVFICFFLYLEKEMLFLVSQIMVNKELINCLFLDFHEDSNIWSGFVDREKIIGFVEYILDFLKITKNSDDSQQIEITIVFSNDSKIQELNKKFREQNNPTNVLSFPQYELEPYRYDKLSQNYVHLGDLIFAFETINQESIDQQKDFCDHFMHLLLHGILHLLGFDHISEKDRDKMESLEIKILQQFNITSPYE